jgi:hypothetical protein
MLPTCVLMTDSAVVGWQRGGVSLWVISVQLEKFKTLYPYVWLLAGAKLNTLVKEVITNGTSFERLAPASDSAADLTAQVRLPDPKQLLTRILSIPHTAR